VRTSRNLHLSPPRLRITGLLIDLVESPCELRGSQLLEQEREKPLAEHLGATALHRRRMTCGSNVG
jgi:hypothetical protein